MPDDGGYLVPPEIGELLWLRMRCESRWLRAINRLAWKLFKKILFDSGFRSATRVTVRWTGTK